MQKSWTKTFMLLMAPLAVWALTLPAAQAANAKAPLTPSVGTGKSLQGYAAPRAHPNKPAPLAPSTTAAGLAHLPHPGMGTPPHHMHHPQKGAQ